MARDDLQLLQGTLDVLSTDEQVKIVRRSLNAGEVGEGERTSNQRRHVRALQRREDVTIEPPGVPRSALAIDLTRSFGVWRMRHGTLVEEEGQPYARRLCKTRAS